MLGCYSMFFRAVISKISYRVFRTTRPVCVPGKQNNTVLKYCLIRACEIPFKKYLYLHYSAEKYMLLYTLRLLQNVNRFWCWGSPSSKHIKNTYYDFFNPHTPPF